MQKPLAPPCQGGGWEGVKFYNPTLALPFKDIRGGNNAKALSSSPCQGGGWEGVKFYNPTLALPFKDIRGGD
jgi:hypothetical protein